MRNKSITQISKGYTVITLTDGHGDKTYDVKITDEKYRGRYGKFKTLQEAYQEKRLRSLQDYENQFSDDSYKKNKLYQEYFKNYEKCKEQAK